MAGWVLRPLGEMTATVRRITADRLDRRLAASGPDDELKGLADCGTTFLMGGSRWRRPCGRAAPPSASPTAVR
ncbi:HAMP domain-containing protein [Nonomuraea sp. SYSU D8015]|uniref:HAMP domain-containing protein n=1 Tax=Nonomuraea sp. SYSU D8015 TaxID=2593644 RepID=UPI001CB6F1D0|nr:HAMP domain-containing protein [Nonomuraea sp. SYSU D8015]